MYVITCFDTTNHVYTHYIYIYHKLCVHTHIYIYIILVISLLTRKSGRLKYCPYEYVAGMPAFRLWCRCGRSYLKHKSSSHIEGVCGCNSVTHDVGGLASVSNTCTWFILQSVQLLDIIDNNIHKYMRFTNTSGLHFLLLYSILVRLSNRLIFYQKGLKLACSFDHTLLALF